MFTMQIIMFHLLNKNNKKKQPSFSLFWSEKQLKVA